jgi:PKD repeat protein
LLEAILVLFTVLTLKYPEKVSADLNHCGILSSNETWQASENVHIVTCDVTIPAGISLTIESGAIVKFQQDAQINVIGRLVAQGASNNPIYFTSYYDDAVGGDTDGTPTSPQMGDWGQIRFASDSDDTSIITRAVLRYSGSDYGTNVDDGAIWLDNASPELSYITFTDNYINGVELRGGNWSTDIWDNTTVVYVIEDGDIVSPPSGILTINPDMRIKLGKNVDIAVLGKLVASGTITTPIYFSSIFDDTLCGIGAFGEEICDTHNDGSLFVPQVGDWGQIQFTSDSNDTSIITRAILRYSGSDYGTNVDDSAIRLDNASPNISYTVLENNHRGIDAFSGSTPALTCNDIYNNTSYGIYNNTPAIPVTAENHWWGDSSGPTHSGNPGGTGQVVSDGVDYTPWATQPCMSSQAAFTAEPTFGPAPLTTVFTNNSKGHSSSLWDFGDGHTSTLESPTHTYTSPGSFDVTLIITGPLGTDTITKIDYITVYEPVAASFTAPITQGVMPLTVDFINQSTGDFSSCVWDFGDGETSHVCNNPRHVFTIAGIYTVSLTVTGPGGLSTVVRTDYIVAEPRPPTLNNIANNDGDGTYIVNWSTVSGAYNYELQEQMNGGDWGTLYSGPLNSITPTPRSPALWCYKVRALSSSGISDWSNIRCTSVYELPIAAFTASPTEGMAPLTVEFTNQSSGDYTSCIWDFGDGDTSTDCANPVHTYTSYHGPFTVTLTISGPRGDNTKIRDKYIDVQSYWICLPLVSRP